MRIAYIGNFEPEYSTENDVRKAFEHLGHEVIKLQENKLTNSVVARTVWQQTRETILSSDMVLITSTWDTAIPLNEWLTLMKECAQKNIPTATLHLDTFWGTSRGGRQWWLNPMFHTAYIFTADGDYEKEWKAFGKNHIWLPPAVRHDAVGFGKLRKEYGCDVAFVGSNGIGYHEDVWGYRKELVNNLREMCKRNGWSFKNPGGDHPKVNRDNDMNDFYASAKVTVGDSLCLKKEDSSYWSDRVPEATGRGGFLIMPRINEMVKIYNSSVPTYMWNDWKGLEELIEFNLKNTKYLEESKVQAYNITRTGHTYVNRVETILKTVGLQ